MRFEQQQRLRIYMSEQAKYGHRPLYEHLVDEARSHGIAGATVFKGVLSFGMSGKVHTAKILELSPDLPVVIDLIDSPDMIASFLPLLETLVTDGRADARVTLEEVLSAVAGRPTA